MSKNRKYPTVRGSGTWMQRGSSAPSRPPDYRACYELRWLVEDERITGLRFRRGSYTAVGRYQLPGPDNAVKE